MANGGIIGPVNIPTSTTATGVWQQDEQYEARVTDTWPERPLFTTKSLRFDDGSSDNLSKTFGTNNGEVYKWTYSFWVKRSSLGEKVITASRESGTNNAIIRFTSGDALEVYDYRGGMILQKITSRLFRDVSAWYHIVVSNDNSVSSPDTKIYINGVQETSFSTDNEYSQNERNSFNSNYPNYIGQTGASSQYFDGYIAEFIFVDGQALAPTSFGSTNSDGVWIPAIYTGTFGTNGFNLQFENAAALGTDSSPNGNTFTVNNLTSIDQSTDYPVVNYATLNPLDVSGGQANTLSDGNLKQTTGSRSGAVPSTRGTFGAKQGKWYIECKSVQDGDNANRIGVAGLEDTAFVTDSNPYSIPSSYTYQNTGDKENNDSSSSYGNSYTSGDIIGIALDLNNGAIWFSKNGTWQNSATQTEIENGTTTNSAFTGLDTTTYSFTAFGVTYQNTGGTKGILEWNFGSPSFSISSSNADGNGYGNFEYAVPSGYYALNTANLAEFG